LVDWEKQLNQLESKIKELREFSGENDLDLSQEISLLESKARRIKKNLYKNLSPWQKVKLARHMERPTTLDYIEMICSEFVELRGDRYFGDDPALVGGIGRINNRTVTIIGHQKGRNTKENIARNFGMPHPEGYRKALRLMEQAEKFNRPIINFIDTPGAYPGIGAEERGQAEAIAKNLREMMGLKVPIIVVVTGEGGSGGALALGVGDYVYMLEHAVYSVISPEGCASILWKDASKAEQAAESLRLTAQNMLDCGIIDRIIEEPEGGCHRDWMLAGKKLKGVLQEGLNLSQNLSVEELLSRRWERIRNIGEWETGKVDEKISR